MKAQHAWVTLYGLSCVIACGPSVRQQAVCDLQKNVGALEQRLRRSEHDTRALDERLMVLDAQRQPAGRAPPPGRLLALTPQAPDAAEAQTYPAPASEATFGPPALLPKTASVPEEGISLLQGRSLAAGRSIRVRRAQAAPASKHRAGSPGPEVAVQLPRPVRKALHAFHRGAFAEAFSQLARFIRGDPKHPAADRARFWMGECKFEQGALLESIAQFARLEREHPKSPKAPEALLKMGLAFEKLAAPDEASATYRRLIRSFPHSASAELASTRLAPALPQGPAS